MESEYTQVSMSEFLIQISELELQTLVKASKTVSYSEQEYNIFFAHIQYVSGTYQTYHRISNGL